MSSNSHQGPLLTSATVQSHVDHLRTAEGDFRSYLAGIQRVTNGLRSTRDNLSAAAHGDAKIDEINASITNEWIPMRTVMEGAVSAVVDSLERGAGIGVSMMTDLHDLEWKLALAEVSVVNAKSDYDQKALLEDVPVLDAIERFVRSPVDQAYDAYRSAVSLRDTIIGHIADKSAEWVNRLRNDVIGNIAMPEMIHSKEEEYQKWITNPGTKDVSVDGSGHHLPLWVPYPSDVAKGASQVVQGYLGDCYFAAAIASVASTDAGMRYLRSLMVDNGDGTFTVTIPGLGTTTIDGRMYDYTLPGQQTTLSAGQVAVDGAYWYLILEKAFAELKGGYDDIGGGGLERDVFRLLGLGGNVTAIGPSTSNADLVKLLERVSLGVPVTASCDIQKLFKNFPESGGHALSVIGYTAGPPVMVTLRNPWGDNSSWQLQHGTGAMGGGIIQMSLEDFKATFSEVAFADVAP